MFVGAGGSEAAGRERKGGASPGVIVPFVISYHERNVLFFFCSLNNILSTNFRTLLPSVSE